MLGSEVENLLVKENIDFTATDIECDITNRDILREYSGNRNIEWIINCSAYTAVDKAEDEQELAYKINATGAENIAAIANEIGASIIHMSTDYVFNGEKECPYLESDPVNPQGIYGKSKAEGEALIENVCNKYFIIRTAWLYGKNGKNFVSIMLRLFSEKEEIGVVDDQWGSPTYARDLAEAIIHIIKMNSTEYGIYHFTNEGKTNWYLFAKKIYRKALKLNLVYGKCNIKPVSSVEYPTRAKRPKYSLLSKEKIKEKMKIEIADWQYALQEYLEGVKSGS